MRDPLDDEFAEIIEADKRRQEIDDEMAEIERLADTWWARLLVIVVYLVIPAALLFLFVYWLDEILRRIGW